ncbi:MULTISPECIES: cation transporter [Erythrobacteraceae]|jgi:Co/Zn/Cd efflux system component|uniref:Cation diffusion facilitator family transporter n=1 Tax=Erythrobacter westpacificensis TaxID=1055231 RepID=A0ABP9KP41_9SPHN|nr:MULTISPECIES: cation transporter [Erythrobacteraceae]MBW3168001.1 cation transporter [Qipengyuania flava]MBY5965239.1 cation transporter [Qipengyuania flava]MBY6011563.1 cation transporter [Qipengyuania flava]MBY6026005.1 cation transporter [Qipengyuania flava]MCA0890036.1 cation transporter [Qipengyuania flava]
MGNTCCGRDEAGANNNDPTWRRILWIALGLNAIMFGVEIVAGIAADSRALQADALDFLGDAANYAISLGVAGMAIVWRARAALVKAATMLAFGLWVLGSAIWGFFVGASPDPGTMGAIGSLALAVNLAVAAMLFRYRSGDANMRSVWICSRNDAIGNIAVLAAAIGVFGTGRAWPDLVVASIMAGLAVWGSAEVFKQARGELRST